MKKISNHQTVIMFRMIM